MKQLPKIGVLDLEKDDEEVKEPPEQNILRFESKEVDNDKPVELPDIDPNQKKAQWSMLGGIGG